MTQPPNDPPEEGGPQLPEPEGSAEPTTPTPEGHPGAVPQPDPGAGAPPPPPPPAVPPQDASEPVPPPAAPDAGPVPPPASGGAPGGFPPPPPPSYGAFPPGPAQGYPPPPPATGGYPPPPPPSYGAFPPGPGGAFGATVKPARGGLILGLAIVGLLCCSPLSIVAFILGSRDLKEIDAGRMDPSGRGTTNIGRILGLVGIVFFVISLVYIFLNWDTILNADLQ